MKEILQSLAARNGIIVAAFILVRFITPPLPSQAYSVASVISFVGGLFGLIWANSILQKHMSRFFAFFVILGIIALTGFITFIASFMINKSITEYRYRLSGMEMTNGCNIARAMRANMALYETPDSRVAKENLEFWKRDVRWRGHQGTIPILTNANHFLEGTRQSADGLAQPSK